MPTFDQTTISAGAPEEVWKLLYDPARFPEWWAGIGSVDTSRGTGDYTMFPLTAIPTSRCRRRWTAATRERHGADLSCLVSDLCFSWRLRPAGTGTEISLYVPRPPSARPPAWTLSARSSASP